MSLSDSAQQGCAYSFLDFTLDLAAERLIGGKGVVRLRPKSFQVLRYLVEHHGRLITRDELMEAVWGQVAVTDESITKCIADIRRGLSDDRQEIIRTVTRRGFLFQAEVRRMDQCRIPDGPQDSPYLTAQSTTSSVDRLLHNRWAMFLAVIVLCGVVGSVVFATVRPHLFTHKSGFEAIAVLPFESLSNDVDQQYLADGMTEALITNLGQASSLRVIARTSVGQYRGTKKSIREIARELNVDVLVEGTFTRSGERLRVTANLIQASPEKHIWARSYERSSSDALALQTEVAGAIAVEIQGKLTPAQQARIGRNRPVNPEAQVAYWKARYFLNALRDPEAARRSIEYSEQAVRLEPGYAAAHAALAMSYVMLSGGSTIPLDAAPRAKSAAHRAIALDDKLADAYVALGSVLLLYEWDWIGAEREFKRGIELNPSNAEAHRWLSNYLAAVGRVDEAVAESKRARELDPLSFRTNWNVGRILCFARKYEEALSELRDAAEMQRNSSMVDVWIVKVCLKKGLADEAIATDLQIRRYRDGLSDASLHALRTAYSKGGVQGYWAKLRDLLFLRFRSTANGAYRLAEINASLGKKDEAFQWLEKAYEARTNWMPWMKVDPSLDPLRSDPRFDALLRRMGL